MTYRKIDSFRSLFRVHVVVGILFFSVFTAWLAAAAIYAEKNSDFYSCAIQRGGLTPSPVSEKDDAAVRWDYRFRTVWVWRLNYRALGRLLSVPPKMGSVEPESSCRDTLSIDQLQRFEQVNIAYFRRLWQKIFPTRAGPLV